MKNMPMENVEHRIYVIRKKKVMLDQDLAKLYGVPTGALIQAVKRNAERFPEDFMYRLMNSEVTNLKSQIVISSWGGRRQLPYAFTEQGVAMLSGVLNSSRAIAVNIEIMRAFVRMREASTSYEEIKQQIEELERKYDGQFRAVFKAIKVLIEKIKDMPGDGRRF